MWYKLSHINSADKSFHTWNEIKQNDICAFCYVKRVKKQWIIILLHCWQLHDISIKLLYDKAYMKVSLLIHSFSAELFYVKYAMHN